MKLTTTQLRSIIKEEVTKAVREADEGGSSGGGGVVEKMKELLAQYFSEESQRKRYEIEYRMDDLADEVLGPHPYFDLFEDEKMDRYREAAGMTEIEFDEFVRAHDLRRPTFKESRERKQPIRRR
jgi:hypothetical protein